MQYMIVKATEYPLFIQLMDSYLSLGWRPQGGVCKSAGVFYQAMVMK